MKRQTKMAIRFGALALGLTLASANFGTSAAFAQAYSVSGCGTCNVQPFSWGPEGGAAITPGHDPQNIGSRLNGLYNTMVIPPFAFGQPPYVPAKPAGKYGKRKAR